MLASPDYAIETKRLERFGFSGISQNDEDGIINEIFARIGRGNSKFVEFGASSGTENNTSYLLWKGWSGLWIDGSAEHVESLRRNFSWAGERLKCVQAFLTTKNINSVISGAGIEGEIDLLSIDVDGNDFHLWEALTIVNPRVVVIEYNGYVPPEVSWVMQYDPSYVWDGKSRYLGASLEALNRLAKRKGYSLVGCNLIGLNSFFVRRDLTQDKFAVAPSAETLFHPRRWWLDMAFKSGVPPLDRPFIQVE